MRGEKMKIRYNKKAKKFFVAEDNGKLIGLQSRKQLEKVLSQYQFDVAEKKPDQWFYI